MKAIVLQEAVPEGPVSAALRVVEDWPEPNAPAAGEVLLQTECTSLNHMDLWVAKGIPGLNLTYPRISGVDACARVIDCGPGVDPEWKDRRVFFNAACSLPSAARPQDPSGRSLAPEYELIGEHTDGAHRERFVVPVANVVEAGDVPAPQAAATGVTFLTAYSMMVTKAQLRPGQRVLITGIGGGVATAALALARWLACPVAVTSRHPSKLQQARDLGAELTIHDTGEPWWREVRAWSHKRGVDLAIDTIGEATFASCVQSLARGGAFVTAGATSGRSGQIDLTRVFWNQLRVLGSTMGSHDEMREVGALLRSGKIEPVVDRVYRWDQAHAAWDRLQAGEQMGKIVLDWGT